jgi:hypothetical protein
LPVLLLALVPTGCDPKVEGPNNGDDQGGEPVDDGVHSDPADPTGDEPADPTGEPADPTGDEPSDPGDDEPVDTTCTEWSAAQACEADDGQAGMQFCDYFADGLRWGACMTAFECTPGESRDASWCNDNPDDEWLCDACGDTESCTLWGDGTPGWEGCDTPLVLSFDGAEPEVLPAPAATFDIAATGACFTHDWPTAATPWLALDLDRSGAIESGRELFGSGMRTASGRRAQHGFAALGELDADADGRITAADPRFGELVLWFDHDADKRSSFAELEPIAAHGIVAIELGWHRAPRCDTRGNCGIERASFTFVDRSGLRTGEIVDVHLACQ